MTTQILALMAMSASGAMGQFPQQPQQGLPKPVISPYLNLLRSGPAYNNYYNFVQPQIQAQNAINNLQQQVNTLQNTPQAGVYGGTGSDLISGKQVGYFTHRGYFLNNGGVQANRYLAGQQGGGTANTVFQPQQQQQQPQPTPSTNIMPYRR